MPSILGLSFEGVDEATTALTADLVRLVRGLAEQPIVTCAVGADRTSRYAAIRTVLPAELPEATLRRVTFWASRARGRAQVFRSADAPEARAFDARLRACELFLPSAGLLRAAAAIQAIFQRTDASELRRTPLPLDEPVLVLCVSGPAAEGLTYEPTRRELFVPSTLTPPTGDECVVRLVASRHPPVAVRARVVEPPSDRDGPPAIDGFTLALRESRAAHELLVACLTAPGPSSYSRRRAPRHRLLGPVRISGTGANRTSELATQPAFLGDLSAGGAFIRTDEPYTVGERVQLSAVLPNGCKLRADGTVVHKRAEGMGLRFDEPTEGADALAAVLSELGGRPPRILVVDDDALIREMLSDAFRERGYDVLTAPDGTFGIHTLTDQLFTLDLLVTDVMMPGLDGEELVRTIRKLGGERDLPILVVTGSLPPQVAARLRDLGANDIAWKSDGVAVIVAAAEALLAPRTSTRSILEQPIVAA